MSPRARETSAYEVRCPRCDVTFPVGTPRCIHCGGPTGPGEAPGLRAGMRSLPLPAGPGRESSDEDEAEARPRGALSRGVAVLWLLAALAVSIYRACSAPG